MPRLALALLLMLAAPAAAQDVVSEPLDAPRAFAPGIDVPGALDAAAWQGTPASTATRLLDGVADPRRSSDSAAIRTLLRRVVLAGLSPPQGAGKDFETARIRAVQAVARPGEYTRFAARNNSTNDPRARADAALAAGDLLAACALSDTLQSGRGESFWVRLRAACHAERGETAAAELARELLIERGEETELEIAKPTDPFWSRVAREDAAALGPFLSDLALTGMDIADGIAFDLGTARADPSNVGTAQLYQLALGGDAEAAALFVRRGEAQGQDPDWLLDRLPAVLDPAQMAAADLPLFARHAAAMRNVALMQALYGAADSQGDKKWLALASDALGGGFFGRPMGDALEGDIDTPRGRADALVALALGAFWSDAAEQALIKPGLNHPDDLGAPKSDWVAVDSAVERGARAESYLRIADIMRDPNARDRYQAIRVLRALGANDLAGQMAAEHFVRRLERGRVVSAR